MVFRLAFSRLQGLKQEHDKACFHAFFGNDTVKQFVQELIKFSTFDDRIRFTMQV